LSILHQETVYSNLLLTLVTIIKDKIQITKKLNHINCLAKAFLSSVYVLCQLKIIMFPL